MLVDGSKSTLQLIRSHAMRKCSIQTRCRISASHISATENTASCPQRLNKGEEHIVCRRHEKL